MRPVSNQRAVTVNSHLDLVPLQEKHDLTVCALFCGSALLYSRHEERLKLRYVRTEATLAICSSPLVCLDTNGRMRCFL